MKLKTITNYQSSPFRLLLDFLKGRHENCQEVGGHFGCRRKARLHESFGMPGMVPFGKMGQWQHGILSLLGAQINTIRQSGSALRVDDGNGPISLNNPYE